MYQVQNKEHCMNKKFRHTLFVSLFLFLLFFITFIGCKQVNFEQNGSINIDFANGKIDKNYFNTFSAKEITLDPEESIRPLEEFYNHLGNLVGSYTPSKFRLFIMEIVLYNKNKAIELDIPFSKKSLTNPDLHYADFVEDYLITPNISIPVGDFTGLFFFFSVINSNLHVDSSDGSSFTIEVSPSVEVTVPGYGGVWVDEFIEGINRYNVKYLGDDKYHFTPSKLQPRGWFNVTSSYLAEGEYFHPIEMFVYLKDSPYRAILPGIHGHPDIWDTSDEDTIGLPDYGSNGPTSAIIMPFDGIQIPEEAHIVTIKIIWDLEGIIEVYDNGTPEDKSNHIIVLAKDWWKRFRIILIVE